MQKELAQRLLSATLNWNDKDVEQYLDLITDFAELKYDEYQQYRPGSRFLENLSAWLNQFEAGEERKIALNFILNKLVFISSSEMHRLIDTVYPQIVFPKIKAQAISICEIHCDKNLPLEMVIDLIKTKSLFMAMSDGARIDVFRRSANLEHDQVCADYDLSEMKFGEIISEMERRVDEIDSEKVANPYIPDGINHVFLLDDFSGSGISYLRNEQGEIKGKISKVLKSLYNENDKKVLTDNTQIHIVLYLATEMATKNIKEQVRSIYSDKGIKIDVSCVQIVKPTKLDAEEENLFKKHYCVIKDDVEDKHYCKGNMEKPHYGFNSCGLPLVLHHNTPNNSFPILWAGKYALFPRVKRHKEVR